MEDAGATADPASPVVTRRPGGRLEGDPSRRFHRLAQISGWSAGRGPAWGVRTGSKGPGRERANRESSKWTRINGPGGKQRKQTSTSPPGETGLLSALSYEAGDRRHSAGSPEAPPLECRKVSPPFGARQRFGAPAFLRARLLCAKHHSPSWNRGKTLRHLDPVTRYLSHGRNASRTSRGHLLKSRTRHALVSLGSPVYFSSYSFFLAPGCFAGAEDPYGITSIGMSHHDQMVILRKAYGKEPLLAHTVTRIWNGDR